MTPPARKRFALFSAAAVVATGTVLKLFGLGGFTPMFDQAGELAKHAAENIPDDCARELCAARKPGELVELDGGRCECP